MVYKRKMQKLKNCTNCGRLFVTFGGEKLCIDCAMDQEEKERKVLEYIREHQGCSVKEVIKELGISYNYVKNTMDKGMFANVEVNLYCASCGRHIKSGTYCTSCLNQLRKETKRNAEHEALRNGIQQKQSSESPTIERLNKQILRELEMKSSKKPKRIGGMYERITSSHQKK